MSYEIVSADGTHDRLSPTEGWGDVPVESRAQWSRYMVDFTPWFPGVNAMVRLAPGVLHGNTRAPRAWKQVARDLHAVGFTPTDYYLLCQDLDGLRKSGYLNPDDHGHLFTQWSTREPGWGLIPDAAAWAPWIEHVRAGRSPRRATSYILLGGPPPPMGYLAGITVGD